ncbi:MAG: baseplate J/gp47 family protein [Desulfarculus sp.]|nr:baseplate J/gp47 family protein [Desulfarculus sp.]
MTFERPTLQQLIDRAVADVTTRLPGADALTRRSNLNVLTRVHAGGVHGLYGYLDYLARQLMPDTAQAAFLERWAGIWGLRRKSATTATGAATIYGSAGFTIPAGALLQRSDGARFWFRPWTASRARPWWPARA